MRRGLLLVLLLAFGIVSSSVEGQEKLSQAEKAKRAKEVKALFQKKCAKCHGPEGVRETKSPKGEFGFVLDLGKLGLDPKKIVRGNPDESGLFNLVMDDMMPFAETEEPLPASEKEIIRRWILAGAPTEEGKLPLVEYRCPATRKYHFDTTYSPEDIKDEQFSTRLKELPDGFSLFRCSFSSFSGKVGCTRYKVDRVEVNQDLKIKKYYAFGSQINFQIFTDLKSVWDDGLGGIQYGKCEFFAR